MIVDRTDAAHAFLELLRASGVAARRLNALEDDFGGPYLERVGVVTNTTSERR